MGQVISGQTSVGTVATLIDGVAWQNPVIMQIRNNDTTTECYIGGPDVTTINGLQLGKEQNFELTLYQANQIYCVSPKNGHTISWIAQRT